MSDMTGDDIVEQSKQVALVSPSSSAVTIRDLNNPVTVYMNPEVFGQIQRVAKLMCHASLAPKHLQGEGKMADCFLVVGQALRWGMDPFAVAQGTFTLSGKLGYEGKLVAAVVNRHLARNLDYSYHGEGQERRVTVTGTLKGEQRARTVEGSLMGWRTQNEQWTKNPDQMLAYRGAREWARRHMPEAILGVMTEDEIASATPLSADAATDVQAELAAPISDEPAPEPKREPEPEETGEEPAPTPEPARTDMLGDPIPDEPSADEEVTFSILGREVSAVGLLEAAREMRRECRDDPRQAPTVLSDNADLVERIKRAGFGDVLEGL